jgi:hypothetical protein
MEEEEQQKVRGEQGASAAASGERNFGYNCIIVRLDL